jgi:D-threo-aldose 1-dehydrogenase
MFRSGPPLNPVFDFSRDGVLRSLDESLERLGLDRVDIVYIHDPDDHYEQALRAALPALESLRDEGVIRAIGVGMTQWEMLVRFAREATPDCFLIAGRYTLLDQSAGRELLPLCHARGIRVMAGGVFNSGVLADPHSEQAANYDYQPASTEVLRRARRMEEVCSARGVSLQAAAMQFPLRHPATAGILIGPRTVDELEQNLRAFAEPVDDDLLAELLAVAE